MPDKPGKLCRKKSSKRWNSSSKGKEATRRFAVTRREWMQAEKVRRGCTDCGYNTHPVALDFDHIHGDKKFNLSQVSRSLEALQVEISKCVVRCSNCHRIRTAESRQAAEDKRTIDKHKKSGT